MTQLPCILVIDDDQSMLRLIRAHLGAAGYQVETASDGEEGLRLAESLRPRIIILDLLLPGIDGFVVCRRVRENPNLKGTSILMMTAVYLSEEDQLHGFRMGADDYLVKPDVILSKPVHLKELRTAVESLLSSERGAPTDVPAPEPGRDKVLIVDDDEKNIRLLKMRFASEGFEVCTAASGQEGLDQLEAFSPNVMLMDLKMPTMSGLDVLKIMREHGQDIPVVIMTAYGSESIAVDAFKMGADDYLVKPFDTAQAVRQVAQLVERHRLRKSQEQLTDRLKRISCDLVNRVNHLEVQNQKLEKAYNAVRGLSEFNRRFISSLSQDLRAPLSTILSFLSLMRDTSAKGRDFQREREAQEIVFKTAFRLEINLANLLYLSRIQAGALSVAPGAIALEPTLETVLSLARRSLGREDIRVTWYPEQSDRMVEGDEVLMRDILVNLLDDAIQRIEGAGEIILEVLPPKDGGSGSKPVLRLRDTGSRHPDEDLVPVTVSEIAPESAKGGSEGIRLNLCRHLAEAMGWRLTLSNRPTGGGEALLEMVPHEL